jgi:adenylate kinase family enzyme
MDVISIISLVAFIVFLAGLLTSVYVSIRFRNKYVKAHERYIQALVDKNAIEKKLQEFIQEKSNKDLEKTDGFVKFISESRDWAFEYIEQTQSVLTEFVEKVGPVLDYYDKYGRIHESESMNKILDAYQNLITVLPENENTNKEKS